MLIATTAQAKIAALRGRYRIVQGGTSASKTFSIIPLLIQYAIQTPNSEISVVAESIPHIRRGALRDFEKIMQWSGNWIDANFNRSTLTYKFSNGSFIEFFSADQPDKLRGARRDVLFVNEANNINFEAFQQMAIRTKKFAYLDFNPTAEFWAHTELKDQPGTDFIILTYKDNEALEPAIIAEIEAAQTKGATSDYWRNWWSVYGLGQVGTLQGAVFTNWSQCQSIPEAAKYMGTGLDFGFTNDPSAAVDVYRLDGDLYVDEIIYQTQLHNADLARLLRGKEVYADSAEPKSIAEIQRAGVRIYPTVKGADSINYGIDILQRYNMHVTQRSLNLIRELRAYVWDTDKTGARQNKPIDAFNHSIDALRYLAQVKLNNKARGVYAIH
jgi:phage terminase large subunit